MSFTSFHRPRLSGLLKLVLKLERPVAKSVNSVMKLLRWQFSLEVLWQTRQRFKLCRASELQLACQVRNFNKAMKCCGQFPSRSGLIRGRARIGPKSGTANGNGVTSIIPSDICFWRRVYNGFIVEYCRRHTLGWLIYTVHRLGCYPASSLVERLLTLFTY